MSDRDSAENVGLLPWTVVFLLVTGVLMFVFAALPESVLEWLGL